MVKTVSSVYDSPHNISLMTSGPLVAFLVFKFGIFISDLATFNLVSHWSAIIIKILLLNAQM